MNNTFWDIYIARDGIDMPRKWYEYKLQMKTNPLSLMLCWNDFLKLQRASNVFINVYLHLDCHRLSWLRKHWRILPNVQSVLSSLLQESYQSHSDELLCTYHVLKLRQNKKKNQWLETHHLFLTQHTTILSVLPKE